jgi:hypothetical protein
VSSIDILINICDRASQPSCDKNQLDSVGLLGIIPGIRCLFVIQTVEKPIYIEKIVQQPIEVEKIVEKFIDRQVIQTVKKPVYIEKFIDRSKSW